MSKQDKPSRLLLNAWYVESLRLTAFPVRGTPLTDISWWTELVGEPAETKTIQPRVGGQTEQGEFLGAKLVNQIQPHRVDWQLQLPDQETQADTFPTVGPFLEIVERFVELMLKWLSLETCPELHRLAFGAVLVYPIESRVAGYQQLAAFLPSVKLDLEGSSDFLYQINRVRTSTSKIEGLRINRLSRWSVTALQRVDLSFEKNLDMSIAKGKLVHACRLYLDINTVPEFRGPLPEKQRGSLFEELVFLAKEIASEGDIP